MNARVEDIQKFGTLIAWVPLAALVTKRKDAFFGARAFFITPGTANGRVKTAVTQTVEQRGCFQRATTALRPPIERVRAFVQGRAIRVDD